MRDNLYSHFKIIKGLHSSNTPIPLIKRVMKFFENGYNRGWEIFTRNGGKARNGGVGFIMGEYCLCPLFKCYPPTTPQLSSHLQPHLHCSFCCHVSLAEWVITLHLMCYLVIISIITCQALVP